MTCDEVSAFEAYGVDNDGALDDAWWVDNDEDVDDDAYDNVVRTWVENAWWSICERLWRWWCSWRSVFFVFGERQDRVMDIMGSVVTICSTCELSKFVTLTTNCWVNFIYYCVHIDNEAKELNHKTWRVAFCVHIGEGWYVSWTDGYSCIDIRIFVVSTFLTDFRVSMCVLHATVSVFVWTSWHIS